VSFEWVLLFSFFQASRWDDEMAVMKLDGVCCGAALKRFSM
jgi:hypothetical protein